MTKIYKNLEEFLGSYFHQDWTSDAPSSMQIVANYLAEWPIAEANAALQEITSLLSIEKEDELRKKVIQMGCYFEPSSEGYASFTDWMKAIEKEMCHTLSKRTG
ncbi:MAG: hypothetical protein KF834_03625 [Burkholderiales bacterium]|nr:hypothetical protein [Burkholderiales bacterium]